MTSSGIRTLPRRLLAVAATLLLAVAAVVATAAPASAHDQLIGSTPAADSTVEGMPTEIVLTFSAVIAADPGASEVQVTDAAGTELAGDPVADGTTLTVPLEGDASGVISVLWKVVSSDGHPISGDLAFTVTPAATPTETPSPTPTPSATVTAAPSETPSPEVTSAPAPPAEASDATPWIIGGLLLLAAVGGGVLYLLVSRARGQKALGGGGGTTPDAGSDTPSER
ncbi:copper resistance protein CopC [Planococcus sp. APC 4015]|nr:copper resistance protein CopC [Planococcus sp. APC 4015]